MPKPKFRLGDYVQVIATPDPWESSGETDSDRAAYVWHVGVVVEGPVNLDDGMPATYLLRFPDSRRERTGQRNIEETVLTFVSRPRDELPLACIDG